MTSTTSLLRLLLTRRPISNRSSAAMLAVTTLVLLTGCVGSLQLGVGGATPARSTNPLNTSERVAHVLNRLAYGPRPGDAERVAAIGVDRWIDAQLHPESIPDSALDAALAPLVPWTVATTALPTTTTLTVLTVTDSNGVRRPDSVAMRRAVLQISQQPNQFIAGRIIRAQMSERQLLEVMTDFWENHFSVYNAKMPSPTAIIAWDRDVIRPRALGKFRDLLGAVAKSNAMLFYLDNFQSVADASHLTLAEHAEFQRTGVRRVARRAGGMNENYARELLELHTLGVDGGYTQQDVIEVARALTGWTLPNPRTGTFTFNPAMHDAESKVILGHALAAGRGIEDGEVVLDIAARHPATARFIATKLARRFVSDEPPASLITRAAATFTRTHGDIAEVVRTIITSREFFARAAFRAKVKTPFELVVSTRRALAAAPDTTIATSRLLTQLGQPLFGRLTPDGWPDQASSWINKGTILQRFAFGVTVAASRLPSARLESWPGWTRLASLSPAEQVDGVIELLLCGIPAPGMRAILLQNQVPTAAPANPRAAQASLREFVELAISSPDFQRR